MNRVVHVYKEPFDVYIGRAFADFKGSKWQNPFKIYNKYDPAERTAVIESYRQYILSKPELLAALPELKNKTLGCWCKQAGKDVPCHGDVLAELVAALEEPK